jgi:hypothetical protein
MKGLWVSEKGVIVCGFCGGGKEGDGPPMKMRAVQRVSWRVWTRVEKSIVEFWGLLVRVGIGYSDRWAFF